ncbi:MAG: hypothetical protein K0Q94_6196 [Paenibacillus sp.]|jgi:hypothetical protein|nr:hypothetical protein [Paenibacillus sp.]
MGGTAIKPVQNLLAPSAGVWSEGTWDVDIPEKFPGTEVLVKKARLAVLVYSLNSVEVYVDDVEFVNR